MVVGKNKRKIIVICHNIRSAFNIGSIFRTADGAGVAGVYLTGYSPAPPHPGIAKTALGAENFVAWKKFAKIGDALKSLRENGYEIVALERDSSSRPMNRYKPKNKIALVLGNEVRGLSGAILRQCDRIIEISMRGEKESLNVSVAFGVAAYSMTKEQ